MTGEPTASPSRNRPCSGSARGDAELAGLVPAGDLLREQVDDRLDLAARAADPRLDVGQLGDRLGELDVGHGAEVGTADVRDRPLGLAPVLADAAGRGTGDVAAQTARLPLLVGEDPGEGGDDLHVGAR